MQIHFKALLGAISDALDYVEGSLFGAVKNHAKRVAYISAVMGKKAGTEPDHITCLAACALLHDNALTEYIRAEQNAGFDVLQNPEYTKLAEHCVLGEKNISVLPFYSHIRNVILYHHERADGKGPFAKSPADVPLFARIIHLADMVDIGFNPQKNLPDKKETLIEYIRNATGTQFDRNTAGLFLDCLEEYDLLAQIAAHDAGQLLADSFADTVGEYGLNEVIGMADIFAKIIDYKSSFTCAHSTGIASKAYRMAQFYRWDTDKQAAYYLAGALHDIGKLAIDTAILEKPGALTPQEFTEMKRHASITREILHQVPGFEDITRWAANHHEKLDGTGYPLGLSAKDLSKEERLMACIDMYQALRESRPYKAEFPHAEAIRILSQHAQDGKLDADIVADIDACFGAES